MTPTPGVRVVLDVRSLQDPGRAPTTAAYLDALLDAFDAEPLEGESFAFLLRSDLDDPTTTREHLEVVGRRLLPPTTLLRSAAMTVDPFVLRGASLGAAWRADRAGAAGSVYHAVGGATLPIASGLPLVVTLLDLAPWELPRTFQATPATRFGQRLRGQRRGRPRRPARRAHPRRPAARRPVGAAAGLRHHGRRGRSGSACPDRAARAAIALPRLSRAV
jgi:hypothetical protein